ncbi:MAG: TonB-dependent receptor [Acidobacteria bacterium]|nr:TonB-dependent receptor [Acidobacteriota bacterium]
MKLSNMGFRAFRLVLSLGLFMAFAGAAFAQTGTSTVSGTVVDQTGAVVPGATVTISNPATGLTRSAVSASNGRFTFPGLAPATYRIEIEASGFKKLVKSDIQATVDSSSDYSLALEPGDVSVVVDVTANSIEAVINTQDATIGNNFVSEQITELPTDLRRVNNLLALQPGVTRDGYVAGGRSDQANITLDGVDINDQQTGGRAGGGDTDQGSALRATTESVEEFRITTVGANANQGRSSGAQVSLVTKSGTNEFRGSAFWFNRPTFGSANDFFNNLAGVERPSLARDVYGGSIGGPIKKDRLFFFYSYEGQYQKQEAPVNRVVPLAHLGSGELRFNGTGPSCNAGGQCVLQLAELNAIYNQVGINPIAVNVLGSAASRYASNNTIIGDGINTGGFLFNAPTTVKENTHIARFDWNPTDSQQIFFRGNYQWDNTAGVSAFPDTAATSLWSHPTGFVIGHNWTISPSMVNNFRYGFTRQAFSTQGDSSDNNISFRFVFAPVLYARTLTRITPVNNITDDFTWIKNNHTVQFGGNIRFIRNIRSTFASAYDAAVTNPSFYASSGAVVNQQITNAGYTIAGGSVASVQAAATALIGRYSQYSGNFTFDLDGNPLPSGTPSNRKFATEEYDAYIQDVWKVNRGLTLTMGLRYALSRPVYEKNGFQVVPATPLGDILERRARFAASGVANNELVNFVLGGPANNGPGFYSMDWNNWQPRIAAAWSPNFENKFLRAIFGKENDSVIRGGFGISNDYFGGQLAVSFDGLSTIGFTSNTTIAANTYNVTTNPAPLFTGFGQDIRALPGIPPPLQRFDTPADEAQRIETSLDSTIVSPQHYSWNVSWGRQLPKGLYFEASYIGRSARNLFGTRDVMALNNLVDPVSGMDWYTAAGMLHDLRAANTPILNVQAIPYFENLFDAVGLFGAPGTTSTQGVYNLIDRNGFDILDWTFVQLLIDDLGRNGQTNLFFHPQYAAFSAYGTFAKSNYHGATFSLRQRLGQTLSYDINYTWSKSMDDVSGLQTDGSYGGQFLLNPLRPEDNYSLSDFDSQHVVNANFLFDIPIGRGKMFFGDMNSVVDAIVGGWSLRGIYRWNTGQPLSTPFDQAQWATNWNVQSNGTRIAPFEIGVVRNTQNYFANPQQAFNSIRNARPGETGERNTLRLPGYQTLDMGLQKSITMPWNEKHKFQFRWEVFNVTNVQYFAVTNVTRSSYGLPQDPELGDAPGDFGRIFGGTQGNPRRMQFGFRYQF